MNQSFGSWMLTGGIRGETRDERQLLHRIALAADRRESASSAPPGRARGDAPPAVGGAARTLRAVGPADTDDPGLLPGLTGRPIGARSSPPRRHH